MVYLESEVVQDLVVLHPKWLCNEIIGNLLSHEKIITSRITGCFTVDDFQLMYPETDALDLLQVLEALEICTQCDNDGEIEYEFPCLNFVETIRGLWERDPKFGENTVYSGVRIKTPRSITGQLKHVFPRIQVQLRRTILQDNDDPDSDLYQWHHGSKFCCGLLEGLLNMDKQEEFLELKVRGVEESRTNAFYFLEDLINIVEQVIVEMCPGLCIERHVLSVAQLQEHQKHIEAYLPRELLLMEVRKECEVCLLDGPLEQFIDLVCLGSEEVFNSLTLGVDLHVSHLTIHTRRQLSRLLDPPDPMGRDWCLLAVVLGLSTILPNLDNATNMAESKTDKVLEEWAKDQSSTIGLLLVKLRELNRGDAVEVLLNTGPVFKVFIYEEQSTDENHVPPANTASTNTLSNLSR